ncbi:DNA (cytosine-5-)-methyltransferase [Facklamia sp. 7083-14-GEN3]|uniref:DNA (cytosine-5-)-methyltransferase n=1 Tax=Facklamia sp. 7083-14-GEN3 TaxID=2973478 RepID=UPI00215D59CE|nr:DNA (cytosine-5-)-methyltransferase [Facklamia sp. 7083-14-GEN3]MCR8968465.1 DNA (cytosine-5-)-methyltransferase [Facklamia sp. 7083-14-GEN3]
MLKVVESFSGLGAQTQALKNAKIDYQILNTVEWEVGAIFAYDILHNGPQDLSIYRHHTKESLVQEISKYNISSNGKDLITLTGIRSMSMIYLKSILYSIERNHNLIDINTVGSNNLPDNIDLFTYSFPCQDLSVSGHFWNNKKGINRDSGGQSSLLWQVERIIDELSQDSKSLPQFLLMENVSAILSKAHIKNFNMWCEFLNQKGYYNKVYTLNAKNFNIPQNRERTYMISIFTNGDSALNDKLDYFFFENNLEAIQLDTTQTESLRNYLKLDYSDAKYRAEAIMATPEFTPSRKKIYRENVCLAIDDQVIENEIARTITTKQDRNPNSGLIHYSDNNQLVSGRPYRNLTPREAFLLMGFSEKSYDMLLDNNIEVSKNRQILPNSKLLKLSGNSIVVNVLTKIFEQMQQIRKEIF